MAKIPNPGFLPPELPPGLATTPNLVKDWRRQQEKIEFGTRPWFLAPSVRILMVTDGSGNYGRVKSKGLGDLIDILLDAPYWWVQFGITTAHRMALPDDFTRVDDAAYPGRAAAAGRPYMAPFPLHANFRFDKPAGDPLSLQNFDQIWLFGIGASRIGPNLTPAEIAAVTAFMDGGGGVLAMGDHEEIGANICSELPRIRHMRKWKAGGPAGTPPLATGATRIDTLQPGANATYEFNDQQDGVPQPIKPKRYYDPLRSSKHYRTWYPHPVLCGLDGTIDVLPDHMHEGECVEPATLPAEFPGGVRPEIIAWGTVLPHQTDNRVTDVPGRDFGIDTGIAPHRDFGILCAFEGHDARAAVGRILVDSTWHHWVRVNLLGFLANPGSTPFRKIKNFYWNVAVWLAPRRLQRRMLYTLAHGLTYISPLDELVPDYPLPVLGSAARDAVGQRVSRCTGSEWAFQLMLDAANVPLLQRAALLQKDTSFVLQPLAEWTLGGMMAASLRLAAQPIAVQKKAMRGDKLEQLLREGAVAGLQEGLNAQRDRLHFAAEVLDRLGSNDTAA